MKSMILTLLALISLSSYALPERIVLLRHAEKMTGPDPELTEQGHHRAHRLTALLTPYKPTALFSTNYNRTKQTLAPLSDATSLSVTEYDPRKLAGFAEQLKGYTGTLVVAGHSNTTPELVKHLSGQAVSISEKEFHKVFIVSWQDDGKATVQELSSD
ncbi:SixA phosphatase family protein [Pseudoalteromonas rubra]|uniref:Phosphohistidine phosphatase n=1 Tax=Pseudoalteromonas rubra TaxID=43658 RepID=A0A5S3X6J4_9GAMM|nr:phosphoglycerate mutase family protein [Pseudoalteromonas rubra]TMP39664.1 phosphohistidine phosphatase [Pseudoalteromonas rubra]